MFEQRVVLFKLESLVNYLVSTSQKSNITHVYSNELRTKTYQVIQEAIGLFSICGGFDHEI